MSLTCSKDKKTRHLGCKAFASKQERCEQQCCQAAGLPESQLWRKLSLENTDQGRWYRASPWGPTRGSQQCHAGCSECWECWQSVLLPGGHSSATAWGKAGRSSLHERLTYLSILHTSTTGQPLTCLSRDLKIHKQEQMHLEHLWFPGILLTLGMEHPASQTWPLPLRKGCLSSVGRAEDRLMVKINTAAEYGKH